VRASTVPYLFPQHCFALFPSGWGCSFDNAQIRYGEDAGAGGKTQSECGAVCATHHSGGCEESRFAALRPFLDSNDNVWRRSCGEGT